eukprot:118187_1
MKVAKNGKMFSSDVFSMFGIKWLLYIQLAEDDIGTVGALLAVASISPKISKIRYYCELTVDEIDIKKQDIGVIERNSDPVCGSSFPVTKLHKILNLKSFTVNLKMTILN